MTRKTMALLAVLAAALLVSGGSALADLVRCKGGKCEGTERADDLRGTLAKDQIFGFGGNDVITASSSRDHVNGGAGDDLIFGEGGVDTLAGGVGADRIIGGDDKDFIFGGSNADTIDSASGEDLSPVADDVDCGSGTDTVTADAIDNVLANCEQVTRV